MATDSLVDRLKRLQENLVRTQGETVELRHEAERTAAIRRVNELPEMPSITPVIPRSEF